jgi:hypothetical protein
MKPPDIPGWLNTAEPAIEDDGPVLELSPYDD